MQSETEREGGWGGRLANHDGCVEAARGSLERDPLQFWPLLEVELVAVEAHLRPQHVSGKVSDSWKWNISLAAGVVGSGRESRCSTSESRTIASQGERAVRSITLPILSCETTISTSSPPARRASGSLSISCSANVI